MFELAHLTLGALQPNAGQSQIDRWLAGAPEGARAIVLESAWVSLQVPDDVSLRQISAGCLCCAGQLVLKVQLTALLRHARPQHMLLLLSQTTHLERFLAQLRGGLLGFRAIEVHVLDQTRP